GFSDGFYGEPQRALLLKYDEEGSFQWSRKIAIAQNSHDTASSITLDSQGNAFVGGYSCENSDYAIFYAKYAPNGNEMLRATWDTDCGIFSLFYRIIQKRPRRDYSQNRVLNKFNYLPGDNS
ncbi:MAG: hypothetical protein GF383_08015, partial [Candidatus Lokiarchaeota archaeon]|nr:hypothetical protein [Candidatus Lokiarchaeota archaeon]MBD3340277.1 hypothetical protein [Candidatus Lokiarchaeota archaeon]